MVLEHEMRNETAALRAGRGSVDRADELLAGAGRLRLHLPASFQAEIQRGRHGARRCADDG